MTEGKRRGRVVRMGAASVLRVTRKRPQLVVVQPYYSWQGHYSSYLDNVVGAPVSALVCAPRGCGDHIRYRVPVRPPAKNGLVGFAWARVAGSCFAAIRLLRVRPAAVHLMECEPVTILLLLIAGLFARARVLVTVHAIRPSPTTSSIRAFATSVQRGLFRAALRAIRGRVIFAVHSEMHRSELARLIEPARIEVVRYPGPEPVKVIRHLHDPPRLLFFGQVREDKGLYDLLRSGALEGLQLTIAGRVLDPRIGTLTLPSTVRLIDRHIRDAEIDDLFLSHDFLLLPYDPNYAGGAGPLGEALAYGMPILCRQIPLFEEIFSHVEVGLLFTRDDAAIRSYVTSLSTERYRDLSHRCLAWAASNTRAKMRGAYRRIYGEMLRQSIASRSSEIGRWRDAAPPTRLQGGPE